jgi:hypothetical protein
MLVHENARCFVKKGNCENVYQDGSYDSKGCNLVLRFTQILIAVRVSTFSPSNSLMGHSRSRGLMQFFFDHERLYTVNKLIASLIAASASLFAMGAMAADAAAPAAAMAEGASAPAAMNKAAPAAPMHKASASKKHHAKKHHSMHHGHKKMDAAAPKAEEATK